MPETPRSDVKAIKEYFHPIQNKEILAVPKPERHELADLIFEDTGWPRDATSQARADGKG